MKKKLALIVAAVLALSFALAINASAEADFELDYVTVLDLSEVTDAEAYTLAQVLPDTATVAREEVDGETFLRITKHTVRAASTVKTKEEQNV